MRVVGDDDDEEENEETRPCLTFQPPLSRMRTGTGSLGRRFVVVVFVRSLGGLVELLLDLVAFDDFFFFDVLGEGSEEEVVRFLLRDLLRADVAEDAAGFLRDAAMM